MRWLCVLLFLISPSAFGASFYISTSGSDSNTCTNQTTDACASFPRCMTVMAAGDTCYALDGTYTVWDTDGANEGWRFDATGGTGTGARKRFTSLSQDPTRVTIKSATPTTQDTINLYGDDTVPGTGRAAYLEFDHLTLEGRMGSYGNTTGLYYHHNIAHCPNRGYGGGNHAFVYTRSVPDDMHKDVVIKENYFYIDSSCDAIMQRTPGVLPSDPIGCVYGGGCAAELVVLYHTNGAVVESNDFVNTSSQINLIYNLYIKEGNKDARVRYNFIKLPTDQDNGPGMTTQNCGSNGTVEWNDRSSQGGSAMCSNEYYQNVIVNGGGGPGPIDSNVDLEKYYNNTIVDQGSRCIGAHNVGTKGATGNEVFNNICYNTTRGFGDAIFSWPSYGATNNTCASQQTYIDNNLYYQTVGSYKWEDCLAYGSFSSLATWKTHMSAYGFEQNSQTGNPLFVDTATNDYRLQVGSPALGMGRGGAYGANAGAYITGSEPIGCTFYVNCHAYNAAEAPSTSGNPRRVDMRGVSFK